MSYIRATALVVMIGLLTGCPGRRGVEPAPALDREQAMHDARRDFQRINPAAQVGLVSAARSDVNLAAVSDIPLDKLQQGDVISFIDVNRRPIVSGSVVRITDTAAHVRYEAPAPDQRHPREGDLAVFVPLTRR